LTAKLHIRLLGSFELNYEGVRLFPIEKSARLQMLLAYLLLNAPHPQSRSQIAFMFWPDTTESQARTNLRKLIYLLQNRLPDADHFLHIEAHTLQWNVAASYQLDVDLLKDALDSAGQDPANNEAFNNIKRLYEGLLLPAATEDWLNKRREELQRRVVKVMMKRADYYERQAFFDEAARVIQRLLLLDPFQETFYRRLMRLRALANDQSGAIRAYHNACIMLKNELGVSPSHKTRLLYERIVSGPIFLSREVIKGQVDPVIPLIGRQAKWESVQAICAAQQSGDSRCVWIFGEAGIGKTRFAEELLVWAYLKGYFVGRTRSYGAHGDLAYAPIAQLLRSTDEQTERMARLDDVWLTEISQILPELLVNRPDLPKPGPLSQSARKIRFYEALCQAILVDRQPVILLFDDLQWCDEETFAWLHYLLLHKHDSQLLVAGTYRNDEIGEDHPLQTLRNSLYREERLYEIGLLPLTEEGAAQLAEAVYEDTLTAAEQHNLFESTNGNPLFVVETMRARLSDTQYQAAGRRPENISAVSLDLPSKVFSLMQYRLGRLSPEAQEVVKLAAVIGRSFEQQLLLAASRLPEVNVVAALAELCDKRVIREQKESLFDFSHDKLRDVALSQVSYTYKRLLSRLIAEAYEALYHNRLDDIVGELAVAYENAGHYAAAVSYYHQASQTEVKRGAYKRAEDFLEKALALINEIADRRDLAALEATLQLNLGNVARAIQRNTIPKAGAAFDRALQLSEEIGDQPGRFQALFGLAEYHMTDGNLAQAHYYCQRCIAVARQNKDEPSLIHSYLMFSFICLIRGEFTTAKENLELVCSSYRSDLAEPLTTFQGQDIGVMAHIYLSCVLWFLGYPEQSDQKMALAYSIAEERGLPLNLAFVCFYQMLLSLIKHDIPSVERYAESLTTMSEQYDIGFTHTAGRVGQAYAAAHWDPTNRQKLNAFEQLFALYKEKVARLSQPILLSLKARLYIATENYEEAQAILNEAFELIRILDDRYTEVEVIRLQAELWTISGPGNPEEMFLHALKVAEAQETKIFQIRTAVSLCRFWQQQGRQAEAYHLLRETCDWFTEGFATSDLQEAQALLNELKPSLQNDQAEYHRNT
jgi:DNA-binding SARP family transcriptional activator